MVGGKPMNLWKNREKTIENIENYGKPMVFHVFPATNMALGAA